MHAVLQPFSSNLLDASHFAWCIKWLLSFSSECHKVQPFGLQMTSLLVTSFIQFQYAVSSDISLWIPVNLFIHPGLLKLGLHSWLHITRKTTAWSAYNCHSAFLTCKHSRCISVILIQGLWSTKHAWLAKARSEDLSGGNVWLIWRLCWGKKSLAKWMAGFQFEENSLEVLHPYWIPAILFASVFLP